MVVEEKNIAFRIYVVAAVVFLMTCAIIIKLTNIQWVEGDYYRKLAKERTVKTFVIPANKGNIYSSDGSLLAISVPNYTIRFDALAPKRAAFEKNIIQLSDSLSMLLGKSSNYFQDELTRARNNKNRYYLLAKNLSFTEYKRLKNFPLFNLGTNKGGLIVDQQTVRQHPIGKIAERTIGYERFDENGKLRDAGIEGAFGNFLNGKDGKVLKQKIAKGQWKPIHDNNEVDPQDGYDVISTIDVYIQDIAHHSLLKQLQVFDADHGCAVVMETKTGEIRAISNLGKDTEGNYYEKLNYAVGEAHEPGSTFKLLDLIALLDDKKADTSAVFKTFGGKIKYRGKTVEDSHPTDKAQVSLARGFELSLNTVMVQAVYNNYKKSPAEFVDRVNSYGLNKKLGLPFEGEGRPYIPYPTEKTWSAITLPWMAFGYGVSVTPMQTLTLYNAIANKGEMVKPIFVREIKEWNKSVQKFDKIVINQRICSPETTSKVTAVLKNVVKRGTGKSLYSKDFSMAGKTGTAQVDYAINGGANKYYASSFVGFFPADEPKYSCIVVVHKPRTDENNYYGADVAGPVFKRIAQKIFTDSPTRNEIKNFKKSIPSQDKNYENYFTKAEQKLKLVPNVKGMSGMDALALLENLKLKVKIIGSGKVKTQSLNVGEPIVKNKIIILELS
jgi:cell division protein FtsI (penicillin-binding protein 3)